MKLFIVPTFVICGLAGSVFAEDNGTSSSGPIGSLPFASTDWSGYYFGGTVGSESGSEEAIVTSTGANLNGEFSLSGSTYGGFAGFNIQNGLMVYGGEVAYSVGDVVNSSGFETYYFEEFFDVKGRVGYAMGRIMAYGVAGWSFGKWHEGYLDLDGSMIGGFNYGAGVDVMLTDNIFVGVEYLVRNLSGEAPTHDDRTVEAVEQSLQLRVGAKF